MVDKTADGAGKEKWYSDQYVASQLERLRNGEFCLVLSFGF